MSKKSDADMLSVMRSRLDSAIGALSDSRTDELDDLRFAAGSPDNKWQWPTDVINSRTANGSISARPCLTINKLPQHIHQITNDQRQNRTSGKVIPANDSASQDVVEIYEGMIRHIEYVSSADIAYDTAGESQVTIGEGYYRIITEYEDEDSFNQVIKIKRIRNAFSVYLDPMMQDPYGEDADWGFIPEDMKKTEYENKYPKAMTISSLMDLGIGNQSISPWMTEDTIRVAEYFYFETTEDTLNLYPDDNTAFEDSIEDKVYRKHYGDPIKSRQSERRQVKWIKTNGYEVLDSSDWAGKHIPIIRVPGNEFEVEGRLFVSGIVRNAKDAQRMYNYHASNEVEMIALAPKAPFIGYGGQFEGYEEKWKTANTSAWPYLEINTDATDGNGSVLPLPQRSQPPMVQEGIIAAKNAASEDIKETTGQYNASIGQQSNERSAKAINVHIHEGDVSTFHYPDNLARAIRYGTKQIVSLIPKIYDTKRIVNILGEDRKAGMVQLDPSQQSAMTKVQDNTGNTIKKIYNLSVGKYDVMVVTGPSFATKRQEALDSMGTILQTNPDLWKVMGDLFVENMDWPGAQQMAKRLFKMVPPNLTSDDDNPALQQSKQQIQILQQQLQQAHAMLQNVENSIQVKEVSIKQQDLQIKAYDAETRRIAATASAANAATRDMGIQTPEQIQDVVAGVIHSAIASGHLAGEFPQMTDPTQPPQEPQQATPPLDPNKMMGEVSKHVLQANQHAHEQQMAELAAQQAPPAGGSS